jgi:superoxide dismutase, Fe-Mn family
MKKRTFIKNSAIIGAGLVLSPLIGCAKSLKGSSILNPTPFVLEPLPYPYESLEPWIDKMTMEIHHDKHHASYVKNLNLALENHSLKGQPLEKILVNLTSNDSPALRNNAGGHWNHNFFWEILSPKPQNPGENTLKSINSTFGDLQKFKESFSKAGVGQFGSGWAWLCVDANKKLFITSTPNQDNPLMKGITKNIGVPILGVDVWEHAYYLKYQNKRADYLNNLWNLINWDKVEKLLINSDKKHHQLFG